MSSPQFDPSTSGPHGLAISNLVVRLLSEYTGRGPTQARTHFNDNLLTSGVEAITGRRVIAFLSAKHLDPDIAIESFMLGPPDGAE
jgi:hypothetical protein